MRRFVWNKGTCKNHRLGSWSLSPSHWSTNDDVIKWKHFPRYWPFVRWIHRYPMNSPHKGQWRGALMFLQGERGDPGFPGRPGAPGPAGRGGGPSGMTGATGPSGRSGVPGERGATGPAGKDATAPPGFVMQQGQRRTNPNNAALGECVVAPEGKISSSVWMVITSIHRTLRHRSSIH